MKRVLLAGATGLVGQATLQRALASTAVSEVVAPTRRPLPAHPKLLNPVVDFDALPGDAAWWQVDAVACALGTTIRDAGSREAFRRVDHDYCLAIARHAHAHGAQGLYQRQFTVVKFHELLITGQQGGELDHAATWMRWPTA